MLAGPPTLIVTVLNGASEASDASELPSQDPIPGATVYLIFTNGNVPNGNTNANANEIAEQGDGDDNQIDTTDENGRTIFRLT